MTRVLLVHQPIDGGVARHVADLFIGLRASGHEAVLCGPQPPITLRGQLEPGDHQPLAMQRAIAPRPDAATIGELASIIDRVRPDVVHSHSSKAGAVARLARLIRPRTPALYTPHGYAMAGFFHRVERVVYREAERGLGLLTSRVLAVCEAEASLARTVTAARRVRVVHNGVDVPAVAGGELDARVAALARAVRSSARSASCGPARVSRRCSTRGRRSPPRTGGAAGDRRRRQPARHPRTARAALGVASSVHFLGEHADPIAVVRGADVSFGVLV